VFLLSTPVKLIFDVNKDDSFSFSTKLIWLFGLVKKDLSGARKKPRPKKISKPKPRKKVGWRNARVALKIIKIKGLPGHAFGLIKDIIRVIKLGKFELVLTIGLDDPAETAFLFMYFGPITLFFNLIPHCNVIIQPSLNSLMLRGHISGQLSLRPIRLVPPLLRFLLSRYTVRIIFLMIRNR
jgi:hypothetical protein